jgi:predicted N-formylglutamate amidohydrolase
MKIELSLALDQKQQMYWRGLIKNGEDVVLEVRSDVITNPNDKRHFVDAYERTTVRLMKEIFKDSGSGKDLAIVQHMLLEQRN